MRQHTRRKRVTALRRIGAVLVLCGLAAVGSSARAQDLQPRPYANVPRGLNFLLTSYVHSQGGAVTDPASPLSDVHVRADGLGATYIRSLGVFGCAGRFVVSAPYLTGSVTGRVAGEPRERDVSGLADATVRFAVNFYGSPALSLADFARYKQDAIVGASLQVSVPIGQYDSARLVNIGTHRWSIRPQIGASKSRGPWFFDASAGVTFYTDNDDFLGGQRRQQDPLYTLEAFAVYTFGPDLFVALGGSYYTGGRTTVDGVANHDLQANSRLAATLSLPVSRRNSLRLFASTGLSVRFGSNVQIFGVAWQYRWGAGI